MTATIESFTANWQAKTETATAAMNRAIEAYTARVGQITGNGDLNDAAKARMTNEARAEAMAALVETGKRARARLVAAIEYQDQRAADAWRMQAEQTDWPQVTARAAEFKLQLMQDGDAAFGGRSGPAIAAELRARMLQSGDTVGLRALRLAVADKLNDWRRDESTRFEATQLARQLEQDARPAALAEIEAETDELKGALIRFDGDVERAAREVDPRAKEYFYSGMRSPLLSAIMGESTDPFTGEQVVFSDRPLEREGI